jgi:hypothetical protein
VFLRLSGAARQKTRKSEIHLELIKRDVEVGYASASQFNREYVRLFGQPPRRDAKLSLQQRLVEVRARDPRILLSIQLSIEAGIIRHPEGPTTADHAVRQRFNDLAGLLTPLRSPDKREVGSSTLPRPMNQNLLPRLRISP